MKWLSLFSGIGGFDKALIENGDEVIAACEIDKYAQQIYRKHFPNIPLYNDARKINPRELPDFEGLCAGFPCQAFSIAGRRKGFEDTRGTVFFEIARIAKERRPRLLLLENVRGLLSHDKGKTYRIIRDTLDEMGYTVEWQLLNSKYFVPQNRERIFIVCHLRGKCSRKVFPIGHSIKKNTKNIQRVGGYSQCSAVYDTYGVAPTISACTHGYAIGNILAWSSSGRSWGREERIKKGEANTLNTGDGCRTQSSANFVYLSNKNANMKNRIQDRKNSWTIQTGKDFGLKEGERIRRLTPLECERLQSFPDNWTEGISDTQRYKCIGNAVTVDVVKYLVNKL